MSWYKEVIGAAVAVNGSIEKEAYIPDFVKETVKRFALAGGVAAQGRVLYCKTSGHYGENDQGSSIVLEIRAGGPEVVLRSPTTTPAPTKTDEPATAA